MHVIRDFSELAALEGPVFITVGFFDGVHRGHQQLLQELLDVARQHGAKPLVITFGNSPRTFHHPAEVTRHLTLPWEKIIMLQENGIDLIAMLKYDHSVASQTAEGFIRSLMGQIKVAGICVGYDSSIGSDMLRGEDAYRALAVKLGIACHFVEPVLHDGEPVKSSGARELLAAGEIARYRELMGHPYFIMDQVEHGKGLGKSRMEIPTANLYLEPEKLAPPVGIYAAIADVKDTGKADAKEVSYPAATCVMNAKLATNTVLDKDNPPPGPSHDPRITVVEAHLIGYEGDLYGKTIRLRFLKHLRDWIDFQTPEQLHCQIKKDIALTRAAVKLNPFFPEGQQ